VAADAKYRSLTGESPLLMYIPALWNYGGRTHVVARTASDPAGLIADVEAAVHQVDRAIPVYAAETMREHRAESLWQQRMAAGWIGAFRMLALVLAAVGLYGVVAQSVAQRTREAGIRIALGAAPGEVSRLVIREGMALGLIGLTVGIPIALFVDAALGRLVAGLSGIGGTMCAAIAAMLLAVILAACWIPARRAARVDPVVALRCE
jgi:putative ABC transport system permease protein